ncbi:MAG: hypothetical protein HOC91_16750 [Nitrospinaceae bacterium]|nr:hypothetical protein [Nitrospinaceae bacterium]MBT4432161.1 hypothetical protein [Nitrospinaceae bacterium]MBT5369655.1 hypothetical protein [Nitrospinaceae bacterium]MBT5946946.1 hypothetical protein [Nitrospinaceae bacterium]
MCTAGSIDVATADAGKIAARRVGVTNCSAAAAADAGIVAAGRAETAADDAGGDPAGIVISTAAYVGIKTERRAIRIRRIARNIIHPAAGAGIFAERFVVFSADSTGVIRACGVVIAAASTGVVCGSGVVETSAHASARVTGGVFGSSAYRRITGAGGVSICAGRVATPAHTGIIATRGVVAPSADGGVGTADGVFIARDETAVITVGVLLADNEVVRAVPVVRGRRGGRFVVADDEVARAVFGGGYRAGVAVSHMEVAASEDEVWPRQTVDGACILGQAGEQCLKILDAAAVLLGEAAASSVFVLDIGHPRVERMPVHVIGERLARQRKQRDGHETGYNEKQ